MAKKKVTEDESSRNELSAQINAELDKPLADGVRHFKETEKGRDAMCESFTKLADKVADERAEQTKVDIVKSLMENMKWTLDQALTASGIQGKERAIIAKQLQK